MVKVRKSRKTRNKAYRLPSGWGHLLLGVLIGLGAGLAVYLFQNGLDQSVSTQAVIEPPTVTQPQKRPDAAPKPAKSQFDFYTLLPEMEVVIPETDELSGSNQHHSGADKKVAYVLQAGSFRRFDEADGLKANLALIGIEANIQTVAINGEDTWYRVRIGPYTDFSQLRHTRSRLRRNNIEYIVLKMKLSDDE
jgi:cell division protein FtsN